MSGGAQLAAPLGDPRGREPMGKGVLVSGALHGAVLLAALFGVDWFAPPASEVLVFRDVAMISAPEFDAAISKAPEAPKSVAPGMSAPMPAPDAVPDGALADMAPIATSEFIIGDVTDEELFPDLTAVLTPLARAKVRPVQVASLVPAAPAFGEAPPAPMSLGMSSMRAPGSPGPQTMSGGRRGSALRIDTAPPPPEDRVAPEAQPKPDTPNRADQKIAANAPDPDGAPDTPQDTALKPAAPDAATEEVVTEADKPAEDASPAPQASAIPVGRPEGHAQRLAEAAAAKPESPVVEDKPEPKPADPPAVKTADKPAETPVEKPVAKPAEKPAAATATADAGADLPVGAPLTSGEVSGIKGAISKVWNKAMLERMPNYEDLVVTMRITLDQKGMIVGKPEMIRPASVADPRFAQAEGAAARALMAAQPYTLPADKFARWEQIEVTFNPGLGVSM